MLSILFLLGLSAVGLGAAGSHLLPPEQLATWQTAVSYQLWHVLAALFCYLASRSGIHKSLIWSVPFFIGGIFLFSGTLYCKALAISWWPGVLAPVGGSLLMLGWLVGGGLAVTRKK